MKVWIDLANSPHPLLFAPVVRRLAELGAEVEVTVRDHAQTAELALARWPQARVVGGPSPGGRLAKTRTMASRVAELVRWARAVRPDVALSHNSYGQLLAARALGIPGVTAMDFEHQPANHLAFRSARRILLPEAVPTVAVSRQGARPGKVVRYPGLKEELYLGDFEPDPGVLNRLGIERRNGLAVVVARTSPAGAAYHRGENPLLVETLRFLARQAEVESVVLARHPAQQRGVESLGLPNCRVPRRAVDARSLLLQADLFIGAGGTMTREAALLGVPTYSLFAGAIPAVDRWLEDQGALRRLTTPADLGRVRPRSTVLTDLGGLRERGHTIEEVFAETTLTAAGAGQAS